MALSPDDPKLTGPSRKWYVLGALLAALPPAALLATLLAAIFAMNARVVVFDAPGRGSFTADRPGAYMIWNQVQGRRDGALYDLSGVDIGDVTITVVSADGGEPLAVDARSGTWMEAGETRRQSIGVVEVGAIGDYSIDVRNDGGAPFVAAVSPSFTLALRRILRTFIGPGALCAMLLVAGVAIIVTTFGRRLAAANRRREAEYAEIQAGF